MDTNRILAELRQERERIDRAITALEGLNGTGQQPKRGRPVTNTKAQPKRGGMSPAARKRMSEMMKARWAAKKKSAKAKA